MSTEVELARKIVEDARKAVEQLDGVDIPIELNLKEALINIFQNTNKLLGRLEANDATMEMLSDVMGKKPNTFGHR